MTATTATEEPRVESKARRELRSRWLPRLAGYAVFLAVWSWASGRLVEASLLPSPWAILREMAEILDSGLFLRHFGATVQKILIGYTISPTCWAPPSESPWRAGGGTGSSATGWCSP